MNITQTTLSIFAATMALCFSVSANAQVTTVGLPLFDVSSNGVPDAILDESELKHLMAYKADSAFASMKARIIRFDPSILDSATVITVTTPDAKILKFSLATKETKTTPFFDGLTRKEITMTSWIAAPNGPGRDYFNAVYSTGGFSAQFSDMSHVYTANSLGTSNRYFLLVEKISGASGALGYMTREELEKDIAAKKASRSPSTGAK